jgi:hypothetical protein
MNVPQCSFCFHSVFPSSSGLTSRRERHNVSGPGWSLRIICACFFLHPEVLTPVRFICQPAAAAAATILARTSTVFYIHPTPELVKLATPPPPPPPQQPPQPPKTTRAPDMLHHTPKASLARTAGVEDIVAEHDAAMERYVQFDKGIYFISNFQAGRRKGN